MTQDNTTAKSGRERDGRSGESGGLAEKTHEAAEHMRDAALGRVESARKSAETTKERAAERVRALGATVRKVGEHMRVEDQNYIATKAGDLSRRLEDAASYISAAEVGTLVRDSEDIARERPMLFFGGALLLGVAAGRFLKVTGSAVTGSRPARPARTRTPRRSGSDERDQAMLPASASNRTERSPRNEEYNTPYRAAGRTPTERGVGR